MAPTLLVVGALFFIAVTLFYLCHYSFSSLFKKAFPLFIPSLSIIFLNPSVAPLLISKTLNAFLLTALLTENLSTTGFQRILRHLPLPSYIKEITLLTFRYSFELTDEVLRIKKAIFIRGGLRRKHFWQASFLGSMLAQLYLRTLARGERVHKAMKLRGYES